MIASIIANIVGGGITQAIGEISKVWQAKVNKQITEIEADAKIKEIEARYAASTSEAINKAATEQFESFQKTARASPIVARAFVVIMVSQTFVLLYYQFLGPAFRYIFETGPVIPDNAATLAVALLTICLGGSPFVFKGTQSVKDLFR